MFTQHNQRNSQQNSLLAINLTKQIHFSITSNVFSKNIPLFSQICLTILFILGFNTWYILPLIFKLDWTFYLLKKDLVFTLKSKRLQWQYTLGNPTSGVWGGSRKYARPYPNLCGVKRFFTMDPRLTKSAIREG